MGRAIVRISPCGGKGVRGCESIATVCRALVVNGVGVAVSTVCGPCDESEPVTAPRLALEGNDIALQQRDLRPVTGAGHHTWCARSHLPLRPCSALCDGNLTRTNGRGRRFGCNWCFRCRCDGRRAAHDVWFAFAELFYGQGFRARHARRSHRLAANRRHRCRLFGDFCRWRFRRRRWLAFAARHGAHCPHVFVVAARGLPSPSCKIIACDWVGGARFRVSRVLAVHTGLAADTARLAAVLANSLLLVRRAFCALAVPVLLQPHARFPVHAAAAVVAACGVVLQALRWRYRARTAFITRLGVCRHRSARIPERSPFKPRICVAFSNVAAPFAVRTPRARARAVMAPRVTPCRGRRARHGTRRHTLPHVRAAVVSSDALFGVETCLALLAAVVPRRLARACTRRAGHCDWLFGDWCVGRVWLRCVPARTVQAHTEAAVGC